MHYDNRFELIIAFVFIVSPQLGVIGPKAQDLVIPFCLGAGKPIPNFHLRALAIRSELLLTRYQTVHIKNLTGKYIMEL